MKNFEVRRLRVGEEEIAGRLSASFVSGELEYSEARRLLENESNYLIAAVEADRLAAFLIAYQFPDLWGGKRVYLYDIEVQEEFRRKGIGTEMVELLISLCRMDGVKSIWVGSNVANAEACGLWESTGAKKVSQTYVEFEFSVCSP